jgi:chromosome segregation ATPase
MEFHDYAAQETSALLARLLANRSEASTQQLRTVRDALEAATHVLEAPPPVDHDIHELVARLTHAAAEQVRRVGDEAHAAVNAVRGELDAQRAESERLAASLAQAEAAANALRTEVQNERERADAADRDLTVTVEAHAELEAACHKAEAAFRHEAQAKTAVEEDLREARGLLELALGETAQLQGQLEGRGAEIAGLRDELGTLRSAHEQLEAARQSIESAREHEADTRAAVERELQEARGLLETALAEGARLGGELEQRTGEWVALQTDLEQQTAECVTLRAELANAREVGAERDAMRAQRDSMAVERDAVVAQLGASSGRVNALESNQARHEETIRQLESALEHARQGEARFREQASSGEQQSSGARAEAEALRREVDRMVTLLDASVRTVDDLASVGTVPELLSALVRGLAVEFPRVALFRVKGNCLEGELQVGFEQTTDVTKFVFPLNLDSLLTRVVTSGAIERLTGSELAERGGTPFGGAPSAALALPIVLQGEPLAVVYAEDSDRGPVSHKSSVGFAKLLVAQTVVLLMRHTNEIKTLNELRDYAAMLLHEAEQMYTADTEAGRSGDEIRTRLKDNLDCARQLYGHRAALEGSAAATLLDEQITSAIEAATQFAQDLATVVGRPKEKKSRRKAEAS